MDTMTPMEEARKRVRAWTSGPLFLSELGLTELPELPAGVTDLWCSYNCLTMLPETLPAGLTTLYCHNNQLLSLPESLPAGLRMLYCYGNQLTRLPETLPADLEVLSCEANPFSPPHKYGESIADYNARAVVAEAASRERIVQRCALVFEELAQTVWHPSRVERLMLGGVDMEDM
jgi:hypothetical protein